MTDGSTVKTTPIGLRPREAAAALGISERSLWTLTKDRTTGIPHARLGKSVIYPTADLERWLSEQAARNAVEPADK